MSKTILTALYPRLLMYPICIVFSGKKVLNNDDPMVVLSTKIPQSLKNRISEFADTINISQSRLFVEAITKYLDSDDQSLTSVEDLKARVNLLEKKLSKLTGALTSG